MYNRRSFIRNSVLASGTLVFGPGIAGAAAAFATKKLTILHTNDVHSRIDPFPMDGSRNQGQGGVAQRAGLIRQIRREEEEVLLLDAGDIFQGTPYFNIYKGEPEIKAMTAMQYDAATIGNHDFDAGLENLAHQLSAHARFPMVISNYDFSNTPMEHRYVPYKIFKKGSLKIGILGVGIELQGLVPENLYGNTLYLDPIQKTNQVAAELKRKNCDLIILLSHLGYRYDDNRISDLKLAQETENVDVIIGGHTHTFLDAPVVVKNRKGEDVIINQVGWAGILLGRMDIIFEEQNRKKLLQSQSILVSKKTQ